MRPDALVVAAASISPMSIEPESPMKMRAGLKLCGRKPRQAPASTTASRAGEYADGSLPFCRTSPIANSRGRGGRDQADPCGEAVQAVDEVHRVDQRDGEHHRQQHALVLAEDQERPGDPRPPPPQGTQNTTHCTPDEHQQARGGGLAGELGDRVELEAVVQRADDAPASPRREHADDLVRVVERQPQRGELVGEQHPAEHPAEHRQPAPARGRRDVHVTAARPGHRAEPQREHARPAR